MKQINRKGLVALLFGALLVSTALTGTYIFSMNQKFSVIIEGVGIVLFLFGLFQVIKSQSGR